MGALKDVTQKLTAVWPSVFVKSYPYLHRLSRNSR
jgi:hypothetical protein